MLELTGLFVYPIKSLGGIAVSSSLVTEMGLQYDRRWMLVDKDNRFMTQRQIHELSLFRLSITSEGLSITYKPNGSVFTIPFQPQTTGDVVVKIWNDTCLARLVSADADSWFSEMISFPCRLVFMTEETRRTVEQPYASGNEITSFSDGYPFLIIGQSSLDELNKRLAEPLPMNRFRPNIVFSGGEAFEEDEMEDFVINDIHFYAVKPCDRCMITTINQENAVSGKEPLRTLATFRKKENSIYFGQNLLHHGEGIIKIGDRMEVIKRKAPISF
jgi:uncharacterized protein YcbX